MNTINTAKLTFVMSDEFVAMVRENINELGVNGVARMAERRYQFRNPKLIGIDVDASDIKRAVAMGYGLVDEKDRLANIYAWLKANVRKMFTGAAVTKEGVANAWKAYRKYVSDKGLERLFGGAGITGTNSIVEREFKIICSNVAESI